LKSAVCERILWPVHVVKHLVYNATCIFKHMRKLVIERVYQRQLSY